MAQRRKHKLMFWNKLKTTNKFTGNIKPLSVKLISIIFKNSILIIEKTHCVCITKTRPVNKRTLKKKNKSLCIASHMKHKYNVCVKTAEFLKVEVGGTRSVSCGSRVRRLRHSIPFLASRRCLVQVRNVYSWNEDIKITLGLAAC